MPRGATGPGVPAPAQPGPAAGKTRPGRLGGPRPRRGSACRPPLPAARRIWPARARWRAGRGPRPAAWSAAPARPQPAALPAGQPAAAAPRCPPCRRREAATGRDGTRRDGRRPRPGPASSRRRGNPGPRLAPSPRAAGPAAGSGFRTRRLGGLVKCQYVGRV